MTTQAGKDLYQDIDQNKKNLAQKPKKWTWTKMTLSSRRHKENHRQADQEALQMLKKTDSERRPRNGQCRMQETVTEVENSRQLPPRRRVIVYRRNCTPPHLQQNLMPRILNYHRVFLQFLP